MTLPNCRLFLVAPGSGDPIRLRSCLEAALEAGDIASLLVTVEAGNSEIARTLTPVAQDGEAAVLIANNVDLAIELMADGIEVGGDTSVYRDARAALGTDLIVGAECGSNRHSAMELAEAGVDYVRLDAFAAGPGDECFGQWWAEVFEVPCVAGLPLRADEITRAARFGVDFVRPEDEMWRSHELAGTIIAQAMAAIAGANS